MDEGVDDAVVVVVAATAAAVVVVADLIAPVVGGKSESSLEDLAAQIRYNFG